MLIQGCPNTKHGGKYSKEADKRFEEGYDAIDWNRKFIIEDRFKGNKITNIK